MKKFYFNKNAFVLICLLFATALSTNGQSFIPGGDITGTWQVTGSPYYIQGEITIPNGETLTIEPGVKVVFMGHFKLNVQGRLLAIGTLQDTIYFTADNTQTGWHGIRFLNTPETNDTTKIMYCSFNYGKANTGVGNDRRGGVIFISKFSKVFISNSLFESNMNIGNWSTWEAGAVIYVVAANAFTVTKSIFKNNNGILDCAIFTWNTNATISNNFFANGKGAHGPIFSAYRSSVISGNIFYNNFAISAGGGIFNMTTTDTVKNNLFIKNQSFGMQGEGGGIKCWVNDKSVIINNTIAFNSATTGGGICCNDNSDPVLINNVIWGNSSVLGSQVSLVDTLSDPIFLFNDIQGGKEEFGGYGFGTNFTGIYENNIDADPLFKDTASVDYNLSELSHCLGTGVDSIELLGNWYHAPVFDFNGNPRPGPSDSKPDMGAFESLLGPPMTVIKPKLQEAPTYLEQNYPNPFNSVTTIKYTVPDASKVTIRIYEVIGREIETLVNEEKPTGTYEVTWHSGNLPGGVYFYRLNAGGFIETKKMILKR